MVDVKELVVATLAKTGKKVMYELFINSKTQLPVITYLELDNKEKLRGTTLEYSEHIYQIKIWSKDIEEISKTAIKVDKEMKAIGFFRDNATELVKDGIIMKVLKYRAVTYDRDLK